MYQVKFKRKIDGREEHVDFGETNGSFLLYKEYWNKPGKYEIVFTPKLRSVGGKETRFLNNKEVVYKFTVLPDLHPKLILSQRESLLIGVTIMTLLAVISLVTWYIVKSKNQKKISFVYQQKEVSKMQLSSIRSQLNPHFMFNALAGIQNLMNSGRIDEGNRYLGKFARLTRNVLDQSEEISLADEKQLL
ncbi:MAG: histidine kinase, partial [Flavobacterium sp.]